MSVPRIVPIEPALLAEAARLHASCFPDEAWDTRDFAQILAMSGSSGHLAFEGGAAEASGFLFDAMFGGSGEIITLGVAPAARRRGIARALLEHLFRRAHRIGTKTLTLEVADDNEAATALYAELGFEQVGTRARYYLRPGGRFTDARLLRLTLAP